MTLARHTNMTLKELTQKLLEVRKMIAETDKEYEEAIAPLKASKDVVQSQILEILSKTEQFSARFDFATVTRAVRKTLQVVDEKILVAHLKALGLTDYIKETVNELFDGTKKEAVKQGIPLPGTEIRETEYISLSESDKEKDKRKISVQ